MTKITESNDNLLDSLRSVESYKSFLQFAKLLQENRSLEDKSSANVDPFGRGELGWENHSITSFLEAAISWSEDSGELEKIDDFNLWHKFASFLYAGKIYE
jgi:hypothetical protein